MIIVKGRELLIPENERYIGTTYDDNSTVRTFRIPRFHEDGMDKSQLDFYVIINYDDGSDPDAVGVVKAVNEDYIVLEWDVGEDITEHSGCLYLWVRGFDHTGTVRWSSFPGVFYIETSGTEPSDLSDLEERISEEDKLIRLAKLYKSQPMTAATAAEMIDREQIYVYVGDEEGYQHGHWYFWDGSAWVPGGVYNSIGLQTDKELIAKDVAADAKAVGDELTDLKNNLDTLVDELALPLYHPETYITFDSLMDLSVAQTYALFDAYVNEGLLTKVTAGYASSSASGTQATEDTSKPIYLYRYRNPMMGAAGYTTGSYAKPILLSSAMHGNEKMGTVVMLTMIEDFKAGKNPQIKHLFDDFGIDFIPVLNPYGYDQSIGTTMETVEQNIGRWNARGVDLNRNGVTCWASSEDTDKGAASLSECESKIIHGLATTNGNNYAFYADIHTERYTESEHNCFGTIASGGGTLRAIFSIVMSNMDKRMKEVYGYDMATELNGLSITSILNRLPMAFIDRCYALDSYTYGVLYEAPRYNDGILYPVKSQKFTCDIFINFLMNMMEFIKRYRPLYNSAARDYTRGKTLQGDILPTSKSGWEYGVVVSDIEYSSLVAIRTVDKIDVRPEAYYDIIPSFDMLYYSLDFTNDSGAKQYIYWTNTKQRIYTGTFTKVRVNVRLGDPSSNENYVINMPSFMHDWDIIMKPAGIYAEDIKSSLSSNYGVIDYAIAQKNGQMVSVAFRMRLTANVPALTYFLTGLPLAVSNYTGLNNVRVYDLRAELCMDCLVNNPDGATVSSLQCLEALESGHGIRGTITYFTMV